MKKAINFIARCTVVIGCILTLAAIQDNLSALVSGLAIGLAVVGIGAITWKMTEEENV